MNINIDYNGRMLNINNLNKYSSIFRLKNEIYKKYDIDIVSKNINFNGIILKNNTPINRYLTNNSTITINQTKLIGGSESCPAHYLIAAIFGGLGFFVICVTGFIPIIVRIYWLLLVNMFKQAKDMLCKYDRIGAMVIGAAIGFLVMGGFVHINNDKNMYLWGIPLFMIVFCLVGSRRIISFFEPMFRKKCIYLDPATRTIRKCGPTSAARIGFLFIFFIKFLMACFRCIFIFLLVFIGVTYLQLAVNKHKFSCEDDCKSMELAKRVGKIATYVFAGLYILFNLPNYIGHIIKAMRGFGDLFPFVLIKPFIKLSKTKLKKFANVGKYYISGLYFFIFFIPILNFIGIGFSIVHGMIDAAILALSKYKNDFDGYKCRVNLDKIIKKEIEIMDEIEDDIDKYLYGKNEDTVKPEINDYLKTLNEKFKGRDIIGSFDNDQQRNNFESSLDEVFKKYTEEGIIFNRENPQKFIEKVRNYIGEIYDIIAHRKKDFINFLDNIDSMSDEIKNILKKIFITEELQSDIDSSLYKRKISEGETFEESKNKWFKVNESKYPLMFMYRKMYCMMLYFINLFTILVDSFGSIDDLQNEMKVSNVAGSACFFAWMVMASCVATGKMS